MKGSKPALLFSCEHGGNNVPAEFNYLFKNGTRTLESHQGLDKGALVIARAAAKRLGVPLVYSETSRLVIDLNRSLHHPGVFSKFTQQCSRETRQAIIKRIYEPYRNKVDKFVKSSVEKKCPVIHLSFHTFTPRLANIVRTADIGLLYDPSREQEKDICRRLRETIKCRSDYRVRLNYPYRGKADGHTTALRKKYPDKYYSGIEIEVNQKLVGDNKLRLPKITDLICDAIRQLI
ncbi:MAG: putative N-formylglutamate amidohydrolase [Gammaproteobacteria bacterium]